MTDLERYLKAIAVMYEPFLELAEEAGSDGTTSFVPAWGTLFNPTLCPEDALSYLAQYVGVHLPMGASEFEARQLIKEHAGFERGTLKAIEGAVSRAMSGSKLFRIIERTGPTGAEEAYYFLILIFNAGELISEATLIENVNAVIPAGIWYKLVIGELTYAVLEAAHEKYSQLEAAHTTYAGMEAEPKK